MSSDRKRHNDDKKGVLQALSMVTQLGFSMIVPICICFFCGSWLDRKLGSNFLSIIGFIIGVITGGWSIYVLIRRSGRNEK